MSLDTARRTAQDNAASGLTEALTLIWQRVLQRPSIGVDDDFFALGGDPSSAVRLFAEIAARWCRKVSPLVIYQAPTIATLAALLIQSPTPRLRPCVVLKEGGAELPVFMEHGLGGSVMELFPLVQHLELSHPLYGLHSRGADGLDPPLERIEDMAEYHLDAIKTLQSSGPYFLIGYSLGGLVMLEIAQRLSAQGERVALLAMLDTYPHMRFLPLKPRARLFAQLARRYTSAAAQWPAQQARSRLSRVSKDRTQVALDSMVAAPYQSNTAGSLEPEMGRVYDAARRALRRYRPRFYRGKIKFVRAAVTSVFPRDPATVWGHLAEEFEVETVPGDHLGMVREHASTLAAVLSRFLSEAFS